jgi:hypothetical protein
MIRRVEDIPATAVPVAPENNCYVLAHSESGHHHVIDSRNAQMLIDRTNTFVAWLDIAEPTLLKHLREFDTHESYLLLPGKHEVRRQRQREHSPEGWRRTAD